MICLFCSRDIVKAAHLKPLEKTDSISGPQQKRCVWNSLAAKRMKDASDTTLHVGNEINVKFINSQM